MTTPPVVPPLLVPIVNKPVVAVVHSYTATWIGVGFVVLGLAASPGIIAGLIKAIELRDVASIAALVSLIAGQLLIILGRGPLSGSAEALANPPAKAP